MEGMEVRGIELEESQREEHERNDVDEQYRLLHARALLDADDVDQAEQPDHTLREHELQQMALRQPRREGDGVADRAGDDRRVADDCAEPVHPHRLESGELAKGFAGEDVGSAGARIARAELRVEKREEQKARGGDDPRHDADRAGHGGHRCGQCVERRPEHVARDESDGSEQRQIAQQGAFRWRGCGHRCRRKGG
jgi:hypothetical protein